MTLSVETLAEAIHSSRSGIPWKVTSQQDLAFRDARAALTAIEQSGYVVVPREVHGAITDECVRLEAEHQGIEMASATLAEIGQARDTVQRIHAFVLSAAPKVQHSEGE